MNDEEAFYYLFGRTMFIGLVFVGCLRFYFWAVSQIMKKQGLI